MSNQANTQLMERAQEAMEYWTGTMHERVLQRDIDSGDVEALRYHLVEAEREMAIQESPPFYNPTDDATMLTDVREEMGDVY